MLKNRKNLLLIIFFLLLAAFLLSQFFDGEKKRNFKETLVQVDTATVTEVVIVPKSGEGDLIKLSKDKSQWKATQGAVTDEADLGAVKGILNAMASIKPTRLAAVNEKNWAKYEVNDSLGTRVTAKAGGETVADFVVGKFNFQPNTRSASTFVRVSAEKEVYAVDGFLSSSFNRQFNDLRDRTFVKISPDFVESISFQYPGDSTYTIQKLDSATWTTNGIALDSASVAKYINGLQNLSKSDFNDSFQPSGSPVYKLTFTGEGMETVTVSAYPAIVDTTFVLHSSLNQDAYFDQGTTALFEDLFVSKSSLMPDLATDEE